MQVENMLAYGRGPARVRLVSFGRGTLAIIDVN